MQPPPVRIKNDFAVVRGAASSCGASLPCKCRVNFGRESANLLGTCDARKERNESDGGRHDALDDDCCSDVAVDLGSYAMGIQLI
jgi:hypothetical protein